MIQKRTYIKTYRKLCDLLDIPFKTNTESRKTQIEEQRQFYLIVEHDRGFFVERRKKPKPDKPKDTTRNGKYNRLMNSIVMNYAMNSDKAKPKHLITEDIFERLRFVSSTGHGTNNHVGAIKEKYGQQAYIKADNAISAKIYDLLNNSLRSLQTHGNIEVIQIYELKNEEPSKETNKIIEELTATMLEERGIANEFILWRKSKGDLTQFYKDRNDSLDQEHGFTVEKKVTDLRIISLGNYRNLNPQQLRDAYMCIFELIKNDLTSKAERDITEIFNKVNTVDGYEEFKKVLGEYALLSDAEKKEIEDLRRLIKLYEEYLVYA